MVAAAGLSTAGVLPVFLLGGLVVEMRREIAVDDERLGLLVATFFLASALASLPGGHLAERAGVRWAVTAAALASGVALVTTATVATRYTHLVATLALAGVGNGIGQPTSNLVLARGVALRRQGLAFGTKQAAIPMATMIAGGTGAVFAGMLGWRWAYGGWAVVALLVVLVLPPSLDATVHRRVGARLREGDVPLATMALLAVAAALGAAVGTSLASFFVSSAVVGGATPRTAGLVLTVASLVGMGARVLIGLVADRLEHGHFRLVLQLAVVGSMGYLGLAVANSSVVLVGASFVAFAAGWGWPGLFNFAVVRWNRNAPGLATAITQSGVFVGGVVGPAAFGAVATRWTFAAAWTGAAGLSLLSAGFVQLGRRALIAEQRPSPFVPVSDAIVTRRHS